MSNEIVVITPKSLAEAESLSKQLALSALMPEALRQKPADVLATVLAGAELGLAPMQSLRGIVIIKGKPTLSADLMGALVKRSKEVCEYLQLVKSDATVATYKTKRVGDPEATTLSFTMEDAKTAGIASDMYRKYPANMLRARCLAFICRAVYPDLCFGLYDPDELEAPPERDVTPPPAPSVVTAAKPTPPPSRRVPIVDVESPTKLALKEKLKAAVGFETVIVTPFEKIREIGAAHGFSGKALSDEVKGLFGTAKKPEAFTADDVLAVQQYFTTATASGEPPPDVALPSPAAEVF